MSLELQNLLQKMLEKDPADRIDMHGIMAHPWVTPLGTPRLTSLQVCGTDFCRMHNFCGVSWDTASVCD